MARRLITDWPIGKAIIDGDHDDDLHIIEQAIRTRRKMKDRLVSALPGARFALDGREGVIIKVNPKRYGAHFDGDPQWKEYTVAKAAVTVISQTTEQRLANLKALGLDSKGNPDMSDLPPIGCSKGMLANGATCACPDCEAA